MFTLLRRIRHLLGRRRFEAELAEELAHHRALTEERLMADGMAASGAGRAVDRVLGSRALASDQARDVWVWPWLQSVGQDARFALRLFAKDRGFVLAAVGVMAIGLGITTAAFTMVNAIFRGLPASDDRIMHVAMQNVRGGPAGVSWLDFEDWRAGAHTFAGLGVYFDTAMNVSDGVHSPDRYQGPYISANVFDLLEARPILGRGFVPEDEPPGAPGTVVLSHALWQGRYAGDPDIIGRTIKVNDQPSVIVGVMPPDFGFPARSDLWVPIGQIGKANLIRPRNARTLEGFGRLRDGATESAARADLETIAARLAQDHPDTNKDSRIDVVRFSQRFSEGIEGFSRLLMGAVALVLLIGCANVANLLLARAAHRSREMAFRVSLGATRARLVRQLLIESLLLALMSGVVAIGVSAAAVRFFGAVWPGGLPYWIQWTADGRVAIFLVAVCLASGVLFGLAPALHVSKIGIGDVLKEGSRSGNGGVRAQRWTGGLVVAEVALTLTLLASVGLMIDSFLVIYRATFAVDGAGLVKMGMRLGGQRYGTLEQRWAFYKQLQDRLADVPEIVSATVASNVPLAGGYFRSLSIDGRPAPTGVAEPTVTYIAVGARYFETLGLRLLRGRTFEPLDGAPGHEHAIVNERFADMFFPGADPVGKRIRLSNTNVFAATLPWVTIVGVSPSVRQTSINLEPDPVVYIPVQADPGYFSNLIVRGRSDVNGTTSAVREAVAAIDADLPLFRVMPLEQEMATFLRFHRSFVMMFGLFGALALVLAAVGVYAVSAYSVAQRTHEIGVRMALGARTSQVVGLFVRRAMRPLAIGLTLGLGASFAVGRLIRSQLFETKDVDPVTLAVLAVLLAAIATAAAFFPSRRAARVDPTVALRLE